MIYGVCPMLTMIMQKVFQRKGRGGDGIGLGWGCYYSSEGLFGSWLCCAVSAFAQKKYFEIEISALQLNLVYSVC